MIPKEFSKSSESTGSPPPAKLGLAHPLVLIWGLVGAVSVANAFFLPLCVALGIREDVDGRPIIDSIHLVMVQGLLGAAMLATAFALGNYVPHRRRWPLVGGWMSLLLLVALSILIFIDQRQLPANHASEYRIVFVSLTMAMLGLTILATLVALHANLPLAFPRRRDGKPVAPRAGTAQAAGAAAPELDPAIAGHCLHCGYSLAGLTITRCPECGTPFDADAAVRHEAEARQRRRREALLANTIAAIVAGVALLLAYLLTGAGSEILIPIIAVIMVYWRFQRHRRN